MEGLNISKRGQHSLGVFHEMTNRGIGFLENFKGISMHSAENNLCDDLLLERFSRPDMQNLTPESFHYFECRGLERCREAVADFLTRKFKAYKNIDANNLVLTTGACAVFDLLAHSLADPGDYFMLFAPCYYGTPPDLNSRSFVKSWIVQLPGRDAGENAFDITEHVLECEIQKAKIQGAKIKAIVIVNPHNPTGKIYSPSTIQNILNFADKYDLHVIIDEIYGLSTYADDTPFASVLSLPHIPRPEMTHLIYAFSKDFGLAGLRSGVLHTWNHMLIDSLRYILYLCSVPVIIQDMLTTLINDKEWIDTVFLPESRRKLSESYNYCVKELQQIGVPVYPSKAGVFIWLDLSKFLSKQTDEAVLKLHEEICKAGVNLAPGTGFYHEEPGWFRLTFAKPKEDLQKGLHIVKTVLENKR